MEKLLLIKNGLYIDPDDIVLLTDIENVDEKTRSSASNMCGTDKNGQQESPRCLITLKSRERDILVSMRWETIMKKIKDKEDLVESEETD